jgi:hypothetical protein
MAARVHNVFSLAEILKIFLLETTKRRDIVSLNGRNLSLKNIGQYDIKHHNGISDKNNNVRFEGFGLVFYWRSRKNPSTCRKSLAKFIV